MSQIYVGPVWLIYYWLLYEVKLKDLNTPDECFKSSILNYDSRLKHFWIIIEMITDV